MNGPPSGLRTWAACLLAAMLSGCHSVLSLLIVELFCVIDKLQVWHSEEGWGQLSVNGRALGIKLTWTHLLRQSYVVEGVF